MEAEEFDSRPLSLVDQKLKLERGLLDSIVYTLNDTHRARDRPHGTTESRRVDRREECSLEKVCTGQENKQ